jgi:hypothetical protein
MILILLCDRIVSNPATLIQTFAFAFFISLFKALAQLVLGEHLKQRVSSTLIYIPYPLSKTFVRHQLSAL